MQHSAIHDPRALSTPSQRAAAADRQRRQERFQAAAAPRPTFQPDPPALPPISNVAFAEAWEMADTVASEEPKPLVLNSVEPIQRAVVAVFPSITLTDMKSARRTAVVVRARQIAMYLAKELTTRSLPDLGRRFGGRDHTTVLHAVRKISALMKSDPNIRAEIEEIKTSLRGESA